MAALALLVTLAIPMGMRGQSDYSSDYTGNITLSTEGGANASECVINISNTDYDGIKAGTSKNTGAVMITVPSGTKYLHIHAAAWNGTTCSLTVTPEGYSDAIALTANSGIANNPPFTFNGDASTSDYYKVIAFSNALTSATDLTFTATGGNRFVIWGVTSEEEGSPALVAIPTFNPTSGTEFGNDGLQVTISCETTGARIYYTLDGSTPDDGSIYYQSAITLTETTTIKAIAYDNDDNTSSVATATYTYVDPNAPGTENNPYTVAQARAAIDAGTGTQGVYATGIVSAIPYSYTQNNGVTFNMVDNSGDTEFLQAYKCQGTLAPEVAIGDVVVVTGNLIKYNSTYEFGQGCQVVSLTHPDIPRITVTPATVEVDAEEHDGTLDLAYENLEISDMTDFDIQYYDAEGEETETPDWIEVLVAEQDPEIGEGYVVSYYMFENEGEARSAYFKVFAAGDEDFVYSNLVTVNQEAYVAPALDYATLPFEFNGGKADIEGTDGLTAEGLGNDYNSAPKLRFDGTGDWLLLHFEGVPGELAFDIKGNSFSDGTFTVQTSEDGETYTDFATYTELGATEHEVFNNLGEDVRYIKWIYTEKVNGNVALGNIALGEYTGPVASITFDPDVVNLDAAQQTIQIPFTYENIVVTNYESFTVHHYDAEGEEIQLPETPWYIAGVTVSNDEGYNLSVFVSANQGEARSAYMKVSALDAANNTVYSNLITINQDAYVAPPTPGSKYVQVTSTADLTSGQYLIVYEEGNVAFNGGLETLDAAGNTIGVTIQNDEISITAETAAAEFTIDMTAGTIMSASGYYIGRTSDANGMNASQEEAYENMISIDNDGNADVVASGGAYLRYNATSGQERFRYYKSSSYTGQKAIQLYKKVEATTETYTLEIDGYAEGSVGGYYLIASPVTVDLTNHDMTTGDFDLYYFDNAQDDEWRNYRQGAFNLEPGTGYLYAKKKATDDNPTYSFELTGVPYNGNGDVELTYTENADFAGFNLIGNPLNTNATLVDMPYYRLNENGSALNTSTETSQINVMEGVFVQATAENTTAHFTTAAGSKIISQLNVKVTRNRGAVLDNAIIRFDNGAMLGKFQLNPNSTKVYITEGNEDYAIVRSAAESEMPVSFKAAENGTYTLSVVAENVEMNYLHLIDNMTGTDVDLLATPSYSFEANTTDYANRFRLVFNANGLEENSNFAFFNGSEWVINNEGEATLQVIDMTGRVISSETVNGNVTFSTNGLTAGVYMMRLVNGNDVKTQKVLVK